ncbi:MAG: hypothetical protein J6I68_00810 [Butyrivibrio sp.]|uniref:hypothetical protein n=1 Tax=Butyrivibrio sp. TaxID=28121 RepID=UPI001B3EA8EB|nr:hypothetical protein [Butyrivibrio sp.]MBP3781768.1 hypothetical protein [Butyrivibrio sp.]
MTLPEIVDTQNLIIKKQADVIDSLFLLLLEHINAAELDRLEEVSKINQIAKLKESIKEL